jgi:hypothetical protein
MGAANGFAGLSGVTWLFVFAIASVSLLWVRLNWAVGGNFFIASLLASPMLSTVNLHWLARPHIFSWILAIGFVLYFEGAPPRFRRRDGVVIALGSILWTNLHASFFLLPAIAAIYAAGHGIRLAVWIADAEMEWLRVRWYGTAALIAAVASLVNPNGTDVHEHVLRYLADSELLDRIGEFQSFNFHAAGSWQILCMMGIAAAGGVLALQQQKVAHFLLTVLFLGLSMQSARTLPLAAILLLPLSNGAITSALRRTRAIRPALRQRLNAFLQYSDRLRLLDGRVSGLIWTPVIGLLVFGWLRLPSVAAQTGFPPDEFPVAAAAQLELLPTSTRLLAPDKYGGYLIYRFHGKLKVFFDGRSDFYGSGFMKDYIRLVEVRPGWRKLLDEQHFTHALLPVNYSLIPALEQIGWKESYRDEVAVLLRPPQPD